MPALAWWSEINRLTEIDGINLTILGEHRATIAPVAQHLRSRHDIVIWSGHGTANNLILSDGETIDGEWLATQTKAGAPRTMLIMACLSAARDSDLESLAAEVSRVGIHTIGLHTEIVDQAASIYTAEFLRATVAGADISLANRVAMRRMDRVCPGSACGVTLLPGLTNGYRSVLDRLDSMEQQLQELRASNATILEHLTACPVQQRTRTRSTKP